MSENSPLASTWGQLFLYSLRPGLTESFVYFTLIKKNVLMKEIEKKWF